MYHVLKYSYYQFERVSNYISYIFIYLKRVYYRNLTCFNR